MRCSAVKTPTHSLQSLGCVTQPAPEMGDIAPQSCRAETLTGSVTIFLMQIEAKDQSKDTVVTEVRSAAGACSGSFPGRTCLPPEGAPPTLTVIYLSICSLGMGGLHYSGLALVSRT